MQGAARESKFNPVAFLIHPFPSSPFLKHKPLHQSSAVLPKFEWQIKDT